MKNRILLAAAALSLALSTTYAHSPAEHTPSKSLQALQAARASGEPAIGKGTFTLTDTEGKQVTEKSLIGAPHLVFFGFTRCGDECPTALSAITAAFDELPKAKQDNLKVVFITVDPDHDTGPVLKQYLKNFNPLYQGWTGTHAQIEEATRIFLAYSAIKKTNPANPSAYDVAHSAFIYLLDGNGKYVTHYPHTVAAKSLAESLNSKLK